MAELLSREKELFKLNQELNLMASSNIKPLAESAAGDSSMIVDKISPYTTYPGIQYGTYHKQKGPSTLLRKKGVSDVHADYKQSMPEYRTLDRTLDRTFTRPNHKQQQQQQSTPVSTSTWLTKSKPVEVKARENKYSTFTRDREIHKTSTYVKYRNPNFTESPSLENLLKSVGGGCGGGNGNNDEHQLVEVEITQQRESTSHTNGNSKKQLSQDNFIKFLKAKVAVLEEDHERLIQDMVKQKELLEQSLESQRRADTQRDQTLNANKHLTEQLRKAEQQIEVTLSKHKEQQMEASKQQREFEALKRDVRMLKQSNANLESRLARAQVDVEAARDALSQLRNEQRDHKDQIRTELEAKEKRVKALKRQRADLLSAYKKQLYLIDNLKRQNSCMEQSVAIGFGEKEFNKVLEWNTKA